MNVQYPDEHFVKMLESRGGEITCQHGDDIVSILDNYAPITVSGKIYQKIVKRTSCRLVCKGITKCDCCVSYRDSLQNLIVVGMIWSTLP